MTREEAIKILEQLKRIDDMVLESPKNFFAINMAIEALEQLSSYEQTINKLTGAIAEQEPFDIETYCREHFVVMVDKDVWEKAEKALKQEPKEGHWIQTNEFFINQDGKFIYKFICSECKSLSYFRKSNKKAIGANACPNCGAKMKEGD